MRDTNELYVVEDPIHVQKLFAREVAVDKAGILER